MAQVDLLVYSSLLFWFLLLFLLFYSMVYSFIVNILYFLLKFSNSFFSNLIVIIDIIFLGIFNFNDNNLVVSSKNSNSILSLNVFFSNGHLVY